MSPGPRGKRDGAWQVEHRKSGMAGMCLSKESTDLGLGRKVHTTLEFN